MTYHALLAEALKLPPAVRARLAEALRNSAGEATDIDDPSEPSLYDKMHGLGLIVDDDPECDLPSDLSTNPKYMEGFGKGSGSD